jgi:hypothetical protein
MRKSGSNRTRLFCRRLPTGKAFFLPFTRCQAVNHSRPDADKNESVDGTNSGSSKKKPCHLRLRLVSGYLERIYTNCFSVVYQTGSLIHLIKHGKNSLSAHIVPGKFFINLMPESDTETFETETGLRFNTARCREPALTRGFRRKPTNSTRFKAHVLDNSLFLREQ